jgi:hypothetical protein
MGGIAALKSPERIALMGVGNTRTESLEPCSLLRLEGPSAFERGEKIGYMGFLREISNLYFAPKSIEKWKDGRVYEVLGVKYVKKVFRKIFVPAKEQERDQFASNYFIGKRPSLKALKEFESGTRFNELVHTPLIVLAGYETVKLLGESKYVEAIIMGALLLMNASCTMLQRYNRTKIYNVMDRREKITQRLNSVG